MLVNSGKETIEDSNESVHEFYMNILNCLPDTIYWVDTKCHLKGCNNNFVTLLGLDSLKDLEGTPYEQMKHFAHWSDKRVEQLKLDDMEVMFSGKAQYKKEEQAIQNNEGAFLYFQVTRVPMYNTKKNIVGLVVVLTDVTSNQSAEHQENPLPVPENEIVEQRIPQILMIEDNLIAQNVEKALLTSLHCNVDTADSGDNALKLFIPGKYDLVLMDIGLEDMSGYVVAKKLREIEKNTQFHVPIVALTGYNADIVKEDCKQYFMEGAVTKPLTFEQAEQIIKHYVYNMDIPVEGLKHS